MNPDRTTAEFVAVEHDVVGDGADVGVVAGFKLGDVALTTPPPSRMLRKILNSVVAKTSPRSVIFMSKRVSGLSEP
jgi:hypothetical protein